MRNLKVALSAACAVVVGWAFTASADIPDWTRPVTAAERTALKTQFPGVKGVKGMVNLGGICGWHYLHRTPGDGLLLFVR